MPSATLASLRAFFDGYPQLQMLWELFSLDVIVDANVIIQDIRWTVLKRRDPVALPALREAIEAGTVKASAPLELDGEVTRHLKRIAEEEGRDAEEFLQEWGRYKETIRFVEVTAATSQDTSRDPDDAPYLRLQLQLGAVIRSDDKDIAGMGGAVINAAVIMGLRDYSREAAYVFSLRLGGVLVSGITIGVMKSLWELLQRGWNAARKIPVQVLVLLAGFLLVVLVHPVTREFMRNALQKAKDALRPMFDQMLDVTADLHTEYMHHVNRGENALLAAKEGIPITDG